VPESVELDVPVVVELVEDSLPELVEAVVPLVPEVVEAVVPEPDTPAAATDSAVRCVCPENEAAATAEKIPVRPAAPARPNLVSRRIRLTPSSRALVLFGDIRFPF
jgi:hypothetical protein